MARRQSAWWKGIPEPDEEKVGITFVDVLFALVVGEILSPLGRYWTIPGLGWSHLGVALVLTLGSWVGYHTSANRPRYTPKFVNLPLVHFLLDVAMVIAYWMVAATAPLPEHSTLFNVAAPKASPLSESVLVAVAFLLYAAWDRIALMMQRKPYYVVYQAKPYDHGRRVITLVFCVATIAITVFAWFVDRRWSSPFHWVLSIDISLIVVLILYRIAKELWRLRVMSRTEPPAAQQAEADSRPHARPPDLLARIENIEEMLQELLKLSQPSEDKGLRPGPPRLFDAIANHAQRLSWPS